MAHSYHHAVSSARKFGGVPEDYIDIHTWLDSSKEIVGDFRHRALRHHAEGCFAAETLFGTTITNSAGRNVPVPWSPSSTSSKTSGASRPSRTGCAAFDRSRGWAASASG